MHVCIEDARSTRKCFFFSIHGAVGLQQHVPEPYPDASAVVILPKPQCGLDKSVQHEVCARRRSCVRGSSCCPSPHCSSSERLRLYIVRGDSCACKIEKK